MHDRYPQLDQAIVLESDFTPWHQRMEGLMAQGARIIAFRGAASANGIELPAAEVMGSMLYKYVSELTAVGTPVALMIEGDADAREDPCCVGGVYGKLVDDLADNPLVAAFSVQTSGWYKPASEGAPLTTLTGRPYETYIFDKDAPEVGPELSGRGLAHAALTQSPALAAYAGYEQVILGAAGNISAQQLQDLARKVAEHRPAATGPLRVTILSAHIDPTLDPSIRRAAEHDPSETRRARAVLKLAQRASHPYGLLFTADGRFALDPSQYPGIAFDIVPIDRALN